MRDDKESSQFTERASSILIDKTIKTQSGGIVKR
jgi:hypothetical protein